MPSEWISLAEASRILGVAPRTVRRLVERDNLPAFSIDGVVGDRFQRAQVEALVQPVIVNSEKKQKHKKQSRQSAFRSRSKRAAR